MSKLGGIISALLVSYNTDGSLDEAGTRAIVRYNIDVNKIDGLYVGGSTGENFLIDTETKKRIFEIVADEAKGEVPLIAQVGGINLLESLELARYVKELGAYAAVSAVTPFYYKFSFAEIKEYYRRIVEAAELDLIIYSIPLLTGVNLSLKQFEELFNIPRIIGVKFTAADFYLLERLRGAFPDKLIFFGFDELLLPAVIYKVDGAIGSTYNVDAPLAKQVFAKAQAGDLDGARDAQAKLNNFIDQVLENGLYQTLKESLRLGGVDAALAVRPPMSQLTEAQKERAKEIFASLKADLPN
ncbi:N-acetylneuraminate lyase [Psittacicella melopsittaci]|uniref:N-acetylneuraminate lyase n=1 Tax=Psittacicella melopsittaci TaxID=2028576 RepID=A0A3A1YCS0_9GAMM|nr:N-acetylneuraminate lyase [Psittacicella melopsittaci]RIY33927.1 N-acetylneuraminate lyase [Psittacicella melopsittaci]